VKWTFFLRANNGSPGALSSVISGVEYIFDNNFQHKQVTLNQEPFQIEKITYFAPTSVQLKIFFKPSGQSIITQTLQHAQPSQHSDYTIEQLKEQQVGSVKFSHSGSSKQNMLPSGLLKNTTTTTTLDKK